MFSVWWYYRHASAQGGRIIIANDCLILLIFQMGKAETGKEGAMTGMIHKLAERESVLVQAYREELVERIGRVISFDGTVQPLQGLHLYRYSVPMARVYGVVEPSLCVVAQGSKEFLLGESKYRYDPIHYLHVTVDLHIVVQIFDCVKCR